MLRRGQASQYDNEISPALLTTTSIVIICIDISPSHHSERAIMLSTTWMVVITCELKHLKERERMMPWRDLSVVLTLCRWAVSEALEQAQNEIWILDCTSSSFLLAGLTTKCNRVAEPRALPQTASSEERAVSD